VPAREVLTLVDAAWASLTLAALYRLLETCFGEARQARGSSETRRAAKEDFLVLLVAAGTGALLRQVVVPWLLGAWPAPR